jgi:hypothetical protein
MQELLDAIKCGVAVHWIGGTSAYYFRSDTGRSCTRTVEALVERGLLTERIEPHGNRTATLPEPPKCPPA